MSKDMLRLIIFMSMRLVALMTVIGLIFSLLSTGRVSLSYLYTANFGLGLIILLSGLFWLAMPTQLLIKKSVLIDHSTYGERYIEERERKRVRGLELVYIGICNIVITAVLQHIVMWVI